MMRAPSLRSKRRIHRSTFESRISKDLTERGIKFKYESQRISYTPKTRTYTPDFILPNGIIIESKGWFTSEDRTKHLLIRAQHPQLDLRFVFQNANNKLSRKSKTSYADWCDKHGFQWAHGSVPQEWVEEC